MNNVSTENMKYRIYMYNNEIIIKIIMIFNKIYIDKSSFKISRRW